MIRNPRASTVDSGNSDLILGQEDPLEEGMATHSSILENPTDRGALWAIVYGVAKSRT